MAHFSMYDFDLLVERGMTPEMIQRMEMVSDEDNQALPDLGDTGFASFLDSLGGMRNRIEDQLQAQGYDNWEERRSAINGIIDRWLYYHPDLPVQRLLDWGSSANREKRIAPSRWERMKTETENFWKLDNPQYWD